jgi:hypothetical protein
MVARRWSGRVRLELRSGFTGLREYEGEHRDFARLVMNREFEAIRKQRPHHQAHLVFRRIAIGARLDVEPICRGPVRQLPHQRQGPDCPVTCTRRKYK